MPSFAVSIVVLSIVQASLVALPRPRTLPRLEPFRKWWWAALPAGSIVAFVIVVPLVAGSAQDLSYLALVSVPILAALALGWAMHGARVPLALCAVLLLVVAWRGGLIGEGAAVVLTGLSCVLLGVVLAGLAPAVWLKAGIVAMALVDTGFVAVDLLQAPNNAVNAAHPALGLPALQRALFGSALMGYGDLFIAALLGALLAANRGRQLRASALAGLLALAFDLLFFAVRELPATVPIALTLIVLELAGRRAGRRRPGAARASSQRR